MEHKPWPLLILAFIHFIEPVTKISFYSFYYHIHPLETVLNVYQSASAFHAFEFFFLFPIAGLAIFAVKKWSFPVFLIVELWVLIINVPYLNELYQTNQVWLFSSFISFAILNLVIVSYLLLPAVRIAYLDPRIRWWEAEPRYSVNLDCKVNNQTAGIIKNISSSGVFIAIDSDLEINSTVALEFKFSAPSMEFMIRSRVAVLHKFTINNIEGYGAQFSGITKGDKHLIKSIIKYLEKSKTVRRPPRRNVGDLILWMITLFKTGKGLTTSTN